MMVEPSFLGRRTHFASGSILRPWRGGLKAHKVLLGGRTPRFTAIDPRLLPGGRWQVRNRSFTRHPPRATHHDKPPMPRRPGGRSRSRSRAKAPAAPQPAAPRPGAVRALGWGRRGWVLAVVVGVAIVGLLVLIARWVPESPVRLRAKAAVKSKETDPPVVQVPESPVWLRAEAESAARAGDWARALRAWAR